MSHKCRPQVLQGQGRDAVGWLFVPQRFYRIKRSGSHRRVESEYYAYAGRYAECEKKRIGADERWHAAEERDHHRYRHADDESRKTAAERQYARVYQELHHDAALARADGAADTDFLRTFRNRRKHDVHDTYAAHKQGDARYCAKHYVVCTFGAFGLAQQRKRHVDLEIGFLVKALEH